MKKIVRKKRDIIKKKRAFFDILKKKFVKSKLTRYQIFKKAITKSGKINLIAEIKKASPSKGLICQDFDILKIAKIYVENGAAAISILTEEKFFLGKPPYTTQVRDSFSIPLLTKDFIIDEGQIYEANLCGASAVLLIVAILTDKELKNLIQVAHDLDLDCLIEVHGERELARAVKAGANIIGVNNRDLRSFEVDLKVSERLIPQIPKQSAIVAESGIKSYEEVKHLKDLGVHAVLIGETFLKAPDIAKKIKEVMNGEI